MAHKKSSTKGVQLPDQSTAIEHIETEDDSLLPKAEELAKLKEVDPKIVDWVMKRMEIEQDSRLQFLHDRLDIVKKDSKWTHLLDLVAMLLAFTVVLLGMGVSLVLILKQQTIIGSIFAGGTILAAAGVFFNTRKKRKRTPEEE